MGVPAKEIFPNWLSANFVLLSPISAVVAFLFSLGAFFEIDARLVFILSFSDFFCILYASLSSLLYLALPRLGF